MQLKIVAKHPQGEIMTQMEAIIFTTHLQYPCIKMDIKMKPKYIPTARAICGVKTETCKN
jgi:hypothetical protein